MDLISLLPIIFQLSPFSLGSFCLTSKGEIDGDYFAKGIWGGGGELYAPAGPGQDLDGGPEGGGSKNFGDISF